MYTTMATWCAACKRYLPHLAHLRSTFTSHEMEMIGFPVDKKDDSDKLNEYVSRSRPAYRLITAPSPDARSAVQRVLKETLGSDALPSTIVTDRTGRIVGVFEGVPTTSELRKLLDPSKLRPLGGFQR